MGVVYEAEDREHKRIVALKTLRDLGPDALLRFKTEFRALQGLHHPNVVDLGELIEASGIWFFTMELVAGEDILSYVRPTAGQFDELRLRAALAQLASGLDAVHQLGLVHRDLKPSNIRVTPEGRVVVLDFGLVADTSDIDDADTVVGTAAYMAPEQAASKHVSPAADWYSVGVLLYEALTGALPFDGTLLEVLLAKQRREAESPSVHVDDLPVDLVSLCERALRFDPEQRPTGAQILAELGAGRPAPLAMGSVSSTTSPFIGRDAELEILAAAFRDARSGHAVTVEIRGESGVGKSSLIHRFTRRIAGLDDAIVLRGRCYERETVPYKALDGVVDSLAAHLRRLSREEAGELIPDNATMLPRVFPVLGRVEAIAAAPRPSVRVEDPHELRSRAFAALRELLTRLAERNPLVIVIDDMQWTDRDSMLTLGDVLRPPSTPAVLVLLSSREASSGERALPGDVRQIELDPLGLPDARRLAQLLLSRAGRGAEAALRIATETGGHPLFLHELVRHSAMSETGEAAGAVRLDDAVWARVSVLPDDVRALLELVCLAGSPLPEETLAVAAELDRGVFAKHLSYLRTSNLIHGFGPPSNELIEPYHDRIRETVAERLEAEERVARHRRIGLALEVTGVADDRPEVALRHFEAVDDRERAGRYAALAAQRATDGLAFERAAKLWRLALDLGDRSEQRRFRIALADALAATRRGRDAAELYLEAAAGADPTTRLACRRKAAELLLLSGYVARGIDVMNALLRELGTSLPATPRRALASLAWHRLMLRLRGLRWTERDPADISDVELLRIDTYHAVSHGLAVVDSIRGMDFQSRGLLLALRTGEPVRVAIALLQEAGFIATAGGAGVARGRGLVEQAKRIADHSGDPFLQAWRTGVDGAVHYFGAEFERARHLLHDAERILRSVPGAQWEASSVRIFQVLTLKHLGALKRLGQLAERYLRGAERRGDRLTETSMRVLCSWRWLVRDDPDGAREDLENTSWAPPEQGFHLQHFWKLEGFAERALYTGAAVRHYAEFDAELSRYARSLLSRIYMIRCAELSLRGRLAVATAAEGIESRDRLAIASAMARRLSKLAGTFPQPLAAALHAAVAVQKGDFDAAIGRLRAASDIAESLDMGWWTAALRYRLGALVGGGEGDALRAESTRWLRAEGVQRPDRMVEVLTPGFG